MALYDSSVLIDYLDARDEAVVYVERHLEERAVTIPLVLFEVYQGEVFETGAPDFDAVDDALEWVAVVDETRTLARAAVELQQALARTGAPLAARDAFVAGAASGLDERLVVADSDFDVPELTEEVDVDVDFLPERG
jgi:hypothetical protein